MAISSLLQEPSARRNVLAARRAPAALSPRHPGLF